MKTLSSLPDAGRASKTGLRIPQIRVMQVLAAVAGALSRGEISKRCGNKTSVVVGRAIGYSDAEKRASFEQTPDGGGSPGNPCPSLLTLGYVVEDEIEVDGVKETVVELTEAGRKAYADLGEVDLPPLRD